VRAGCAASVAARVRRTAHLDGGPRRRLARVLEERTVSTAPPSDLREGHLGRLLLCDGRPVPCSAIDRAAPGLAHPPRPDEPLLRIGRRLASAAVCARVARRSGLSDAS